VSDKLTIQRDFFNTFLFSQLGISDVDATFIVNNYFNTATLSSDSPMTGYRRSYDMLTNAFLTSPNGIWVPSNYIDRNLDVISTKLCCDRVGGVYKEGVYYLDDEFIDVVEVGSCICEGTIICPTLTSGEISPETILLENSQEIITIKVDEKCCSNSSLQSKMSGEWTWDGTRCVLNQDEDNTKTTNTNIITISETPIIVGNKQCLGDTLTLSAYIYFTEPSNRCVDGKLVDNNYTDEITQEQLNFYTNPPTTSNEVSNFSINNWSDIVNLNPEEYNTTPKQNKTCCYDINNPIDARLIIQDTFTNKIIETTEVNVEYIDTFVTTNTNIITNNSNGNGFNKWVKLTTTINVSTLSEINLGVEFTNGLFKCCDYDIYFDDIETNCVQTNTREVYDIEPCVGFNLQRVIDNKKSWVYNPGDNTMTGSTYDDITRENGKNGLNIAQSNPLIIDGGHGVINRVFAPSVDGELAFRDTDYFGLSGVVERHSKLVLNSKEVRLTFNMCADTDCVISPGYLLGNDGGYILNDEGGRFPLGNQTPFPNLIELERFKKTFQGFWIEFMEQFIPATTIFIAGEKWCNGIICEEKTVSDYDMCITSNGGVLSPTPISDSITESGNSSDSNLSGIQSRTGTLNDENGDNTSTSQVQSAYNTVFNGPIVLGNMKYYGTGVIDADLGDKIIYKSRT